MAIDAHTISTPAPSGSRSVGPDGRRHQDAAAAAMDEVTDEKARPIIYLIRHGEKPDDNDDAGLSSEGIRRAQYLPRVFGDKDYNITLILTQHPKKNGARGRPRETVVPLANYLGLAIDDSIGRNDDRAAARAALDHRSGGNVLICWEHNQLAEIARDMGVRRFAKHSGVEAGTKRIRYPDDRFDLIWEVRYPYTEIASVRSEGVPELDDAYVAAATGAEAA